MSANTVTVPKDMLHPAITHEATRRWLTTAGLPVEGPIRFTPATGAGMRTLRQYVADEGGDSAQLDRHIAELLLIGHLCGDEGCDGDEVVLDGSTGRVFSMWLYTKSPEGAKLFPLAPSLDALVRFVTAVCDFASLRGAFAALAGRTGAEAVAEASALLMSVFTEEEWGESGWGSAVDPAGWEYAVPAFWRMIAVIRPMALIAGPGQGLRLELPKGLLDEEFGADGIVRVAPSEIPAVLTHEPTRRFLTDVGLPRDAQMFCMDPEDLLVPLPDDRERSKQNPAHQHLWNGSDTLPPDAEHLLVLGGLMHDFTVLLDGRTGEVHYAEYDADRVVPVNADVSTLAFTVWLHNRERQIDEEHDFTDDFYYPLAVTMTDTLAAVDLVACLPARGPDDFRYWPEVFHDCAGGVL
ncbi:UNVERIFIED_CONTAM: hypothetical protein RKD43_005491 [Streptomyces graminofaciens]